ncbi:MAG: CHAT domain-containing protein [Moorea sp. SIO2B7]|nr:CHAT domain-containing protein [Moorena sp. SIO2B7]
MTVSMNSRYLIILFMLGIFLTFGISPIFSQVNLHNSPAQLVQQGKEYYEAQQYKQAVEKLQQAANIFESQGEQFNQAITLSNISLAYQQLGAWNEAETAIATSFQLLGLNTSNIETSEIPELETKKLRILAPILNVYGSLLYKRGKLEIALNSWQKAAIIYQNLGNIEGIITSKLNQIQALQALGLYQQSKATIEEVEQDIDKLPAPLKVKGLRTLGDVFRAVGNLNNSQQFLQRSLTLAQQLNSSQDITATLLSLGNTFWSLGNLEQERQDTENNYHILPWQCQSRLLPKQALNFYQKAEEAYQKIIKDFPYSAITIKAQLNNLSLLVKNDQLVMAKTVLNEIDVDNLPQNRTGIYGQINLARNLACLRQKHNFDEQIISWSAIDNLLEQAIQNADKIEDNLAKSYALGNRGGLYEYLGWQNKSNQQLIQMAQKLTEEALFIAQPYEAPSIAYQWQWQLGRLLEIRGEEEKAISAYKAAVKTLESVRGDLVTINSDVQFSFRDNVEPVYRKIVDMLLKNDPNSNLYEALLFLDSLQLAELENFLKCDLSKSIQVEEIIGEIDATAAFIYPIILADRLEIIFKLPQQYLEHRTYNISQSEVGNLINRLQKNLARPDRTEEVIEDAQKIYNWLIKPLEEDLNKSSDVTTLVFVLDGVLRNIPMALLYNQGQYLVQKYAIAVIPSRQIFDPRPRQKELKILTAGVSEQQKVEGIEFKKLPYVPGELRQIQKLSSEPIEPLLNQVFTDVELEEQIDSAAFPIIHIATHGEFSSEPSETFILAWGKRIKVQDLDNILKIRSPDKVIELLVLSACKTAQGNRRATLGLAGIAAKARVRTTLATLWQVDDQTTANLMNKFYEGLKSGKTIAQALQEAELELLKNKERRPHYWAPFVVVGNWL